MYEKSVFGHLVPTFVTMHTFSLGPLLALVLSVSQFLRNGTTSTDGVSLILTTIELDNKRKIIPNYGRILQT
jgi:hypothetical protein